MSERVKKAAAVVLRGLPDAKEVLVFDHPLEEGGVMIQLPAGTVEQGEAPGAAAIRELFEETGVQAMGPVLGGVMDEVFEGEERIRWVYIVEAPAGLPDEWPSVCDCGKDTRCHWLRFDDAVIVEHQQPWIEAARAFLHA